MSSLSLRTALSAVLLILVTALAGVGALGLWELRDVQNNVVQIGGNWLPSVGATLRLKAQNAELRRLEFAYINASDAERPAIEEEMTQGVVAIDKTIARYTSLISSQEEQANFDAYKQATGSFRELRKKMIEFARAGRNDEAKALLIGDMKQAGAAIVARLETAVEMNEVGAKAEVEKAAHSYELAFLVLAVAVAVGVAIGLAGIAFTILRVLRPIDSMTKAMGGLAGGDMAVEIPGVGRADEIGGMAGAVQVFKESMVETERLRRQQAEAEIQAAEKRKADMRRLADEFERAIGGIVGSVSDASGQLEGAAMALTKTAETTLQLSTMVAAASEETSANVSGVAAASEQLASTVTEISRQVQESSTIANQAVVQAGKTNDRVSELSQSAERIGDVIGLINTIAGQTNLLALNATIEAARAGDAGKGFAVVAQEVKALAAQTGKATSEIATQIAGMQTATNEAVQAIREITETINKMSEISGAIAAAVEEQGATTTEISRNVTEAAKGTSEVATNITDVSKGATETGSASTQVLSSAKKLSAESGNLRREVGTFLTNVRAA